MNIQNDHNDRRRHARFELLDYAIVTKEGETESLRSVIVDISLGGLQLRSRTPFQGGDIYTLVIGRGNESPLNIKGESLPSKHIDESDLYATGFKLLPETALQRIEWVEYVHNVFKAQGEMLTQ